MNSQKAIFASASLAVAMVLRQCLRHVRSVSTVPVLVSHVSDRHSHSHTHSDIDSDSSADASGNRHTCSGHHQHRRRFSTKVHQTSSIIQSYTPPKWADHLPDLPSFRVALGSFPTPIVQLDFKSILQSNENDSISQSDPHSQSPSELATAQPVGDFELYVKRDDMTGVELSGNKVRKLEFLLAEAVRNGHDCVVTIGGIQSNHCRATACAARQLGLDSHLILRGDTKQLDSQSNGSEAFVGNLLFNRMSGAHMHLVTKQEYKEYGSAALVETLTQRLREQGKNPYPIPVGGSNWLGTFGYIEFVDELMQQLDTLRLDITDVVVACGSGGTTAGVGLGMHLAHSGIKVHAFGVCDSPAEFYRVMRQDIFPAQVNESVAVEDLVEIDDAKGIGYALSTSEELEFIKLLAQKTGIITDPVYSGKAFHALVSKMRHCPSAFAGRKVLFIHTGGAFGLYDKVDQLNELFSADHDIQPLL
jgi:D-cysteine desulfhydrase